MHSVISGQNPYHPDRYAGNANRWLDNNVWGCLNGDLPELVLKPGTNTYSSSTQKDHYSWYTPLDSANAVDTYSWKSISSILAYDPKYAILAYDPKYAPYPDGYPHAHTCHHWRSNARMNWAVYERQAQCNVSLKFTLLAGTTVVLTDGCTSSGPFGNLYPAVIGPTIFTDSANPVPKVDGNTLPYTLEVEAASLDAGGETVSYTMSAGDDCDASPTVVVHQGLASGSTFPVGDTAVTIRATDNNNNIGDGILTVRVTLPPDSDNDGLSDYEEAALGTGECRLYVPLDRDRVHNRCLSTRTSLAPISLCTVLPPFEQIKTLRTRTATASPTTTRSGYTQRTQMTTTAITTD